MKIKGVRFSAVAPRGQAMIAEGSVLSWLFVEIETDEGIIGTGECSNWLRESPSIISAAARAIAPALIGRDADNIEAIWHQVFRNHTYLGSRGLMTTVLSGIDIALWDVKGKATGRPIFDLLGGALRPALPLYVHPGPEELVARDPNAVADLVAQSAAELVAQGFDALKVDPFVEMWPTHTSYVDGRISRRGLSDAHNIMGRLREEVGSGVELMVDAHGCFNVASALEAIGCLEPLGLTWFEEPLPPESVDGLRLVAERTSVPLCVGERLFTRWDFIPVLTNRVAQHLMPDVCWVGGISELRRIAALAEPFGVPVSPHDALGPIQVLAGAHTMLNTPNFNRLEFHQLWAGHHAACLGEELDIRNGELVIPPRPGLGYSLSSDYVDRHLIDRWEVTDA